MRDENKYIINDILNQLFDWIENSTIPVESKRSMKAVILIDFFDAWQFDSINSSCIFEDDVSLNEALKENTCPARITFGISYNRQIFRYLENLTLKLKSIKYKKISDFPLYLDPFVIFEDYKVKDYVEIDSIMLNHNLPKISVTSSIGDLKDSLSGYIVFDKYYFPDNYELKFSDNSRFDAVLVENYFETFNRYFESWKNYTVTLDNWLCFKNLDVFNSNYFFYINDETNENIQSHQYSLYNNYLENLFLSEFKLPFDTNKYKAQLANMDLEYTNAIINDNITNDLSYKIGSRFVKLNFEDIKNISTDIATLLSNKYEKLFYHDIHSDFCLANADIILKYNLFLKEFMQSEEKTSLSLNNHIKPIIDSENHCNINIIITKQDFTDLITELICKQSHNIEKRRIFLESIFLNKYNTSIENGYQIVGKYFEEFKEMRNESDVFIKEEKAITLTKEYNLRGNVNLIKINNDDFNRFGLLFQPHLSHTFNFDNRYLISYEDYIESLTGDDKCNYDACIEQVKQKGFIDYPYYGIRVFNAKLHMVLFARNPIPVINLDNDNEQTFINCIDYRKTYIDAFKEGEKYFDDKFSISTNELYRNHESYIKTLQKKYWFSNIEEKMECKYWGFVEHLLCHVITHKDIKKNGFNSGLASKVQTLIITHPDLFKNFYNFISTSNDQPTAITDESPLNDKSQTVEENKEPILNSNNLDQSDNPIIDSDEITEYINDWINCDVTLNQWQNFRSIDILDELRQCELSEEELEVISQHMFNLYRQLVDRVYDNGLKSKFDDLQSIHKKLAIAKKDLALIEDLINGNINTAKAERLKSNFHVSDWEKTSLHLDYLMRDRFQSDDNHNIHSKDCYYIADAILKYKKFLDVFIQKHQVPPVVEQIINLNNPTPDPIFSFPLYTIKFIINYRIFLRFKIFYHKFYVNNEKGDKSTFISSLINEQFLIDIFKAISDSNDDNRDKISKFLHESNLILNRQFDETSKIQLKQDLSLNLISFLQTSNQLPQDLVNEIDFFVSIYEKHHPSVIAFFDKLCIEYNVKISNSTVQLSSSSISNINEDISSDKNCINNKPPKTKRTKQLPPAYTQSENFYPSNLRNAYKALLDKQIHENTTFEDFESIFNAQKPITPIVWIGGKESLCYFIKQIHLERKLIKNLSKKIWDVSLNLFVDDSGDLFIKERLKSQQVPAKATTTLINKAIDFMDKDVMIPYRNKSK